MRVLLRLVVGATIVADTVGLVLYGAVAQVQGDTILQDALVIAGAIAFALILILGVAAIESRGRARPKRATAKTAAPRPTLQRIALPLLRPIRPTAIGASEVPAAAQPIPKAPAPAPLAAAPEQAPRVAPIPVRPAPALATRLAPARAMTTTIAPATITPPPIAPEVIAAPTITAELEWVLPAGLDGQVEPQPFFELPRMIQEGGTRIETVTRESAKVAHPAEIATAEIATAETADDDLTRWREHAVSLVVSEPAPARTIVPETVIPTTTAVETIAPETRAPEMDAILRALDVLRASADPEPPRLVVIPGGRTLRAS